MKKRNFEKWFGTFTDCINNFNFFTDFTKVYKNVLEEKVKLNILNSLIGSRDIENDFVKLITKYPEVLECVPILLAVRSKEIKAREKGELRVYNFESINQPTENYVIFMRESGLFDLLENHIINNLIDYVTGVEVGLDSNARKNRCGDLMEDLVEAFIQKEGYEKNLSYYKEMKTKQVEEKWNVDLSSVTNGGKTIKKWDFVIKKNRTLYLFETNFYSSQGSKLNETARSYKTLALEMKDIEWAKFIWITDGQGWKGAKNNLEETFDCLDNLYNINDLNNGVLKNILV